MNMQISMVLSNLNIRMIIKFKSVLTVLALVSVFPVELKQQRDFVSIIITSQAPTVRDI